MVFPLCGYYFYNYLVRSYFFWQTQQQYNNNNNNNNNNFGSVGGVMGFSNNNGSNRQYSLKQQQCPQQHYNIVNYPNNMVGNTTNPPFLCTKPQHSTLIKKTPKLKIERRDDIPPPWSDRLEEEKSINNSIAAVFAKKK